MEQKKRGQILLFIAPVLYLAVSIAVVLLVCRSSLYPSGAETLDHLYRGNALYQALLGGNRWPLYDSMCYGGVEFMRYWAPLPTLFLALCQFAAQGNILYAYLIFLGLVCFLGALSWLYVGFRMGRPALGFFLGLVWFFMPENLRLVFTAGDLARAFGLIFLPPLIYHVYAYAASRRWQSLLGILLSFAALLLCHPGFAGMAALGVTVYLLIRVVITRERGYILHTLLALGFGGLLAGIWLVPFLRGGILPIEDTAFLKAFFQPALTTLNPLERARSGDTLFYFGLAAFVLALLGGTFSQRSSRAGFWAAILMFLCTTNSFRPIMGALPGGGYLWMSWFIPIALCMILCGFLYWERLRLPLVLLFMVLLTADAIPSFPLIYGYQDTLSTAQSRLDTQQEAALITAAQQITSQRLALVDGYNLGPRGTFLTTSWGEPVPIFTNALWTSSAAAARAVQLDRALAGKNYLYLFDRSLELGCDSVLTYVGSTESERKDMLQMDLAAQAVGYEAVNKFGSYRLYHLEAPDVWGTASTYHAIGIGDTAPGLSLDFPGIEETVSTNLNDYTYEELSQYDLIYLSGFTYDDRESAESLILRLSERGVHIVIAADGIPENRKTHDRSFLGVVCNDITFSNGYPELETIDGRLNTDLFPPGYTTWNTVYTEGLDEVWGSVQEGDILLDFYGTVKNDHIVVIGLNLGLFYNLTKDASAGALLSHAARIDLDTLPEREIVPLSVQYAPARVTVTSPMDGVNTALAAMGTYAGDPAADSHAPLLFVNQGETVFPLEYPMLRQGAAASAAGLIGGLCLLLIVRRNSRGRPKNVSPEADQGGARAALPSPLDVRL